MRKKIRESLTARIFFITFLILLGACGVTFGLIAWATPMSYTSVVNRELQEQTHALAEKLSQTAFEDCGPVIDDFIRSAGAEVMLLDANGNAVTTPSKLAAQALEHTQALISITSAADTAAAGDDLGMHITADANIDLSLANSVAAEVTFPDREGQYTLCATSFARAENQVVTAIKQMIPWLLLALLLFSLFCALLYSRSITRPIVRLSGIAGKMAELDFGWNCEERRRDEIGRLGRSLNQMAQKLSGALQELTASNAALRGEVEQERELDRQRMAFFSAASHELKTPVTILKGQLSGMLDGVDVYRDREKYLARALQVTARMEDMIREILTVSRIEAQEGGAFDREMVDISELAGRRMELDADLLKQRNLKVTMALRPGLMVPGNPPMLAKAIGNLFSNAALYSPEGAEIRVWSGLQAGCPALTVENTGVHIRAEALPHLFEAFYREEPSRNRRTGGSGLGLYLVRIIMDRHGAKCLIENTAEGVRATVRFHQSGGQCNEKGRALA